MTEGNKYVISEPKPEHFGLDLSLEECIVLAVVSQTQHLDITGEEQENIAQAVMDTLYRYVADHNEG